MKLLGIIRVDFDITESTNDPFFFCINQILERKWECIETVLELFVDFKKAYDSVRREVFYSIFIEFGVPMELVRLIKISLNETYSIVHIGKHLPDNFPLQNDQNKKMPLLYNLALEYASRKVQESKKGPKLNGTTQLLVYALDVKLLGDN
jgi:hypothetical protein